jgi:hypothetical protein
VSGRRGPWPTGRGDLVASLVLVFPLYLAYAVGILFSGRVNGVDFVSRHVWAATGEDRAIYLGLHGAVALGFLWWLRRSRRTRTLSTEVVVPVVLEATIYALTMGAAIHLVVHHGLGAAGVLHIGTIGDRVVASLGAGVHEELVFRLGLGAGGAWLALRAGLTPRLALAVALVGSSLLFAWAHHVGPHGDPWSRELFAFRALAGVIFALIFWLRSLAHAVYAHVLYDVWVLVVRPA